MGEAYLPEHILHEIFVRMPTKPLVQLKCLSKQWNHLISDPFFMKSRSRRMIFLSSLPFHAIDNTVTSAPSMTKLPFPFGNHGSYEEITIVGSINGIVLLVLKRHKMILSDNNPYIDELILYNPFSGEFKTVPDHPGSSSGTCVYGFGYGTSADDLKIVRLRDLKGDIGSLRSSFDVFSIKAWSWSRPLELLRDYCFYSCYNTATFANGLLYWIAETKKSLDLFILVLDAKKMVFSEIEIPDVDYFICLGTYNGRLCMICYRNKVEGYVLWVMNDHGLGKSWTAVCHSNIGLQKILCILDDGKLLVLKSPKQIVIYDMFKDSYKEVDALTSFVQDVD